MGSRFSLFETQTRCSQTFCQGTASSGSTVARSPYIAKKYGHLLDGYEYYSEIETCKPTLERSLSRNEPTEFSFRRRQFVKYARNEKDMNFCRNNTQLLNFKINSWWPAARAMSEIEKLIVVQSCDSQMFIRGKSCDRF